MFKSTFFILSLLVITISATFTPNKYLTRLDTRFQILREGYPCEVHTVVTPDGYILKLFRIPGSSKSPPAPNKPVVFFQHGLECSSSDWVVMGKESSATFLLADLGYDIWLGNARGNTYSRAHSYLNPDASLFWDFSWHEIGEIDLPTMIDFVLMKTNQKDLHYIGHSQGTTSFFVMNSIHTEMNAKIRTMHALAPVVFMKNALSPGMRAATPFATVLAGLLDTIGVDEFLPSDLQVAALGKQLCEEKSIFADICAIPVFLTFGYDSKLWNKTLLPEILENVPAGSSARQFLHYVQNARSGIFGMFDYGLENLKRYGQLSPPEYNLTAVTAPVYLHYSNNDWFSAVVDVQRLSEALPNVAGMIFMPWKDWNHFDYLYAIDVKKLCYQNVIAIIRANT